MGVPDQKAAWAGPSPHRVPLSRSSGLQSLACDHTVLTRPAAPVASAAFAHAEDCALLSHCPAPSVILPASAPQEEGESTVVWHQTPDHSQGKESDLMGLLLAASPVPPRVSWSWPRAAAPHTGTQCLGRLRAPVPAWSPTHVLVVEQEARVLGFNFPIKLRLRSEMGKGQGPSWPYCLRAHGTEACLTPMGQRVLTVLKMLDVV